MSIWTCALRAFSRKREEIEMSPKDRKKLKNDMIELASKWDKGEGFENVKDANWNNMETFEWLWEKYTHKPLDPVEFPVNFKDIRKFKLGLSAYNTWVSKPRGWFANKFHVTRSALQNTPELKRFEQNLINETQNFRNYTVETSKHVNNVLDSFKELGKSLGVSKIMSLKRMSGSEAAELKKLEANYDLIVQKLQANPNANQKVKLREELVQNRNEIKTFYENGAGDAFIVLRQALSGADVNTVEVNGKMLTNNQKTLFRKIQSDYSEIRTSSVVGLVRGLEKIQQMARSRDLKWADKHVADIASLIKRIEFQKVIDESGNFIDSKLMVSDKNFLKLGFKDGEGYSANGKVKFNNHYMSEYTLGILKTVKKLETAVENRDSEKANDVMRDIREWDGVINRAKGKNDMLNTVYSMDPYYFLRRYTSDVGLFNYKTHVKANFREAVDTIQKQHLDPAKESGRKDLTESSRDMIQLLKDVYNDIAVMDPTREGVVQDLTRIMTGVTYFRLMGGNVRSAARNATQRLHEFVEFGFKASLVDAKKFYKNQSRTSTDSGTMLTRQLKKFGLQWFDSSTKTHNAFDFITNKNINVSTASRGALQDAYILDRNLFVDKNDQLQISSDQGGLRAVTSRGANVTSVISKTAGVMHKVVEDWNRAGTFRTAFALAFQNMSSTSDNWKARQILNSKQKAEIRKRKGAAYEIGYKDLQEIYGATTQKTIDAWVENKSGQIAHNSVLDLHFEYAQWNKAKAIKATSENNKAWGFTKAGLGQFATYRFNMVNLMYKWAKEAGISLKAGDLRSEEFMRVLRFGMLQATIGFATIGFRMNVAKLATNDVLESSEAMYTWLTAKREEMTEEGLTEETKEKLGQVTFKQGGWAFLGPNIQYALGAYELLTHTEAGEDETVRYVFDEALNKSLKKDANQELYTKISLFNSQLARTAAYTYPVVQGGGSLTDGLMLELGLFPSKEQREISKWIWGTKSKKRKKKRKSLLEGKSGWDRQGAIQALELLR